LGALGHILDAPELILGHPQGFHLIEEGGAAFLDRGQDFAVPQLDLDVVAADHHLLDLAGLQTGSDVGEGDGFPAASPSPAHRQEDDQGDRDEEPDQPVAQSHRIHMQPPAL
jgi:hypothetical protein